jgi:hypothetical protein
MQFNNTYKLEVWTNKGSFEIECESHDAKFVFKEIDKGNPKYLAALKILEGKYKNHDD